MLSRPDGQSHSPVPVQCRFVGFEDVKIQAHKRQQDFFFIFEDPVGDSATERAFASRVSLKLSD